MSLLKWQEMAKSKSALGKKINFVHDAITQKKLGEETSQIGLEKMFKPVTSKLDDVVASNLWSRPKKQPARRKKANLEEIDYFPDVDPFEDMDVEGLFDEAVPPQAEKQISAAPPTYEKFLEDLGDGSPPEFEKDDPFDDMPQIGETKDVNELLEILTIQNYNMVDKILDSSDLSATQKRNYLQNEILPEAIFRINQLKGHKSSFTKEFNKGRLTEEQKKFQHERIDRLFKVLREYISHYKRKAEKMKGSGLRRRKKGGAIRFFSNPKELLQKLEVIIGSILAGNTNQEIRNTGVGILDLLLKEGAINRSQHEKLFRKYFKP